MGKHYTKKELLQMMKRVKNTEQLGKTRDVCSWATWCNIVCYFFYKQGWTAEQISDYCQKENYYYNLFMEDDQQWFKQRADVDNFMGDEKFEWLDDVVFDGPSYASKNKVVNYLNSRVTAVNNSYMESSYRYFLSHYRAMVDILNDVSAMKQHYHDLEVFRGEYYNGETEDIYKIHDELVDELGIDIQLPTVEQFKICFAN